MLQAPPIVMSIAGFDPSSGAGITADIKTIAALGCYGVTAITALTVQSTARVSRVTPVEPELLTDTLEELTRDVKVSAVHIGMLGTGAVAKQVGEFLRSEKLPNVVLDPVLISSSGAKLLDRSGVEVLCRELLPLADVITPNIDEASILTGLEVGSIEQMIVAAKRLQQLGARAVVVTGGHLNPPTDVLSRPDQPIQSFSADHVDLPNTHGTGCAFSTAVACYLALGQTLSDAVSLAKRYVSEAIRSSYSIGKGTGPINHMYSGREKES